MIKRTLHHGGAMDKQAIKTSFLEKTDTLR